MFTQQDGKRVSFFARGATWHPDPDGVRSTLALKQTWYHNLLDRIEGGRVTEEGCDADQQVAEKQHGFFAVISKVCNVGADICQSQHLHAALNASKKCRFFVMAEVVTNA